jgi:RNA polymerase sigma factor (TIGR02999 family)
MSGVTSILSAIHGGDPQAASKLLPLVYDQLRELAAARLAQERPGQTLDATSLVHEAYLRLVDVESPQQWDGRGHFFAAAAESMRRILIERARKRVSLKHGGALKRIDLDNVTVADESKPQELLVVHEALVELEAHDRQAATLVTLRYFGGLTHQQAAEALGLTRRAADRVWAVARAWLYRQLNKC